MVMGLFNLSRGQLTPYMGFKIGKVTIKGNRGLNRY